MIVRIGNLVWKEILQFIRDRMLTAFLFLLPVLQLILLAQATGSRIGDLSVAVLDRDHSSVSRRLITDLDNREELNVRHFVESEEELRDVMDRGLVDAGVIFPDGLSRDLCDPSRACQVRVIVDGTNSIVGGIALDATNLVMSEYIERARDTATAGLIDVETTVRYNPSFNLRYFTIPAQVAFITYQITLAIASLGLAREKELGTLEQLIVAPLSRLEIVLGKAIPALIIGGVNFLFMLALAIHLFQVPLRGSIWFLLGTTLLFITAEIGWGMLISSVSRTQQQAILFVFILAIFDVSFSGYLVPVQNLPGVMRFVARLVPMYHQLVVIRAVMLKGATLTALWSHVLALTGLAVMVLVIAVGGVSRRLD